jgi:hypothetical protein
VTAPERAARYSAVTTTVTIGAASFVLSFEALRDLAAMAGQPSGLAWLWPVIVDGSILQATVAVVASSGHAVAAGSRRFFWTVLGVAACVSVIGNALHATVSDGRVLAPVVAAGVATVAPVSLMAATHGLAVLVRNPATTRDSCATGIATAADSDRAVDDATATGDDDGASRNDTDPSGPVDRVARVLQLGREGLSSRQIAARIGIHHSTAARILADNRDTSGASFRLISGERDDDQHQ